MKDLFELEPFGAGYHAAAGRPHNVRMAAALKAVAAHSPICFVKGEYLPCSSPTVPGSGAFYTFGSGLAFDAGRLRHDIFLFERSREEHVEGVLVCADLAVRKRVERGANLYGLYDVEEGVVEPRHKAAQR